MSKRPHVLFVTADQHRGDTLSCEGHPCVRTPHLDLLAYEGVRFSRAYTDCPICIPARTTMITGIQSHVYGMPTFAPQYRIQRDHAKFLGSIMTAAGYQTHIVGKTHWHTEPSDRGGFECVEDYDRLERLRLIRTGREGRLTGMGRNELEASLSYFPPELHTTDWTMDRAMDFIEYRDQTDPFFLWLSLEDPHMELQIHEPYYSMYDNAAIPEPNIPDWCRRDEDLPVSFVEHRQGNNCLPKHADQLRKARGVYYGMVTNIDHQLARIVGKLKRRGLWEDTIFVYTCDHGEFLGDFGDACKSFHFEPTARVPMIFRLPRWMPAATNRACRGLVELADLLPTLCELTGCPCPDDITGRSLVPLLTGSAEAVRDELHTQMNHDHMLHDGRYKYMYFGDDGRELLFDMESDPRETVNLAGDDKLAAMMRAKLVAHLTAEGNADCVDGKLSNLGRKLTPRTERSPIDWLGWAGT